MANNNRKHSIVLDYEIMEDLMAVHGLSKKQVADQMADIAAREARIIVSNLKELTKEEKQERAKKIIKDATRTK